MMPIYGFQTCKKNYTSIKQNYVAKLSCVAKGAYSLVFLLKHNEKKCHHFVTLLVQHKALFDAKEPILIQLKWMTRATHIRKVVMIHSIKSMLKTSFCLHITSKFSNLKDLIPYFCSNIWLKCKTQ